MTFFFFQVSGKKREWGLGAGRGAEKERDRREDYLISDSRGLVSRRTNFSSTHVFVEKQRWGRPLERANGLLKEKQEIKVCDNVCSCRREWSLSFSRPSNAPWKGWFRVALLLASFLGLKAPRKGDLWSHSICSRIWEVPKRFLSASVQSQISLA